MAQQLDVDLGVPRGADGPTESRKRTTGWTALDDFADGPV